ncbi:hypothetical protein NQ317_009497 [Molorchus minor]|uniref:Uncharacterized protein n=1 Tax=Molorchus minor TaxID=1323400 RepID=A0ABQ9IWC7_9CUCU|nr:hypothetical protein NQ317_009497 [Molorchus minor]
MGRDSYLTKEEEGILVFWILTMAKKNPELSRRTVQNLTITRASVTGEQLKNWFQEIHTYLQENNYVDILQNPQRIFNADETAFFLNPKGEKVLAARGEKNVYKIVNSDEKECLTVLITAPTNTAANGQTERVASGRVRFLERCLGRSRVFQAVVDLSAQARYNVLRLAVVVTVAVAATAAASVCGTLKGLAVEVPEVACAYGFFNLAAAFFMSWWDFSFSVKADSNNRWSMGL